MFVSMSQQGERYSGTDDRCPNGKIVCSHLETPLLHHMGQRSCQISLGSPSYLDL